LLPEYKANRGHRAHTSDGMMKEVQDIITLLPGQTIVAPDDEADDVIATHIALNARKQQYIFTKDRDLWQLMHHHMVRVITSSKDPPVTVYQIQDDFHTTNPRLVPLSKALIGDTSDNIPGVKGFSRDDLRLILEPMSEPSIQAFIESAEVLDKKGVLKPRTLKSIRENVPHIERMLRITTLKADCAYEARTHQPDKRALDRRLVDIACTSMLEKTNILYEVR
jgi:DNA polymerase-1